MMSATTASARTELPGETSSRRSTVHRREASARRRALVPGGGAEVPGSPDPDVPVRATAVGPERSMIAKSSVTAPKAMKTVGTDCPIAVPSSPPRCASGVLTT